MKVIGTIVVILLVGMGIATYLVTRPPDRELDAQGRAWVDRYEKWAGTTQACGEAEFAVQINDRDGSANLATTNLHLREAERNMLLSRQKLASELGG